MSDWYSERVRKSREEVWEDLEEDFWRLTGWNADQEDVDSIRTKIDQYIAAEDGTVNALTNDMLRAKERAAFQQGKADGFKEGKAEALKNAVFTDLPYAVREKIILDHAAAEQKEYERGRRDGEAKAAEVPVPVALPQKVIDRHAQEVQASWDAGYASARRSLVFDDLPEGERRRVDGLRAQADQAGYVRGYNEGVAKGKNLGAPVTGREYLPADAVPGQVLQAADGGVWIHIGAPKQLPRESTPRTERPAVTVVTAQSLGSVAPDKRKCRVCQEIKDLETWFYRDSRGSQGRKTICKGCDEERKRAYKKRKKEEAG